MARLDDEDDVVPGEEIIPMEIARGFRLQVTKPLVLGGSLVGRGVIVRLG